MLVIILSLLHKTRDKPNRVNREVPKSEATAGVCGTTAGNKLLGRLRPEPADQGEEIVGGGPLNKGVIQLLCAGTGTGVAAERDHVEPATPAGG